MNIRKMAHVGALLVGSLFLAVILASIGYTLVYGVDIGKLVREHHHQARVEAMKRAAPTNRTGATDKDVADDINHTPKEQLPPVIYILQSMETQTPAGK